MKRFPVRPLSVIAFIASLCFASPLQAGEPSQSTPVAPQATPAPAPAAPAQAAPLAITGKLDIAYNTRTQTTDSGTPQPGVYDTYKLDLDVVGTLNFRGEIRHQPTIFSSVLGRESQPGLLTYNLLLNVRNPKDLKQTKAIGKMIGTVPIDTKGVYQYGNGNLRIAVDPSGTVAGFESPFKGLAAGRPPKNTSALAAAKNKAVSVTKMVKGRQVKITVSDFDEMRFSDFFMAKGPVPAYPEARVNGQMLYDRDRSAWYFNGVTVTYVGQDGNMVTDRLSGSIKWVESPDRLSNGEGEYQFDVRVNEPEKASGEGAAFNPVESEADFFTVDTSMPSLLGTIKYKDEMRQTGGGEATITSSAVAYNLTGNQLNKVQMVNLFKLIALVEVVPMNAE